MSRPCLSLTCANGAWSPAGDLIVTRTSQLLPVLFHGQPAMLKVTGDADERHGHLLMRWWAGEWRRPGAGL